MKKPTSTLFQALGVLCCSVLLTGCGKYGSKFEALNACREWEEAGERVEYKVKDYTYHTEDTFNVRACIESNNQFLGIEMYPEVAEDFATNRRGMYPDDDQYQVITRFRY